MDGRAAPGPQRRERTAAVTAQAPPPAVGDRDVRPAVAVEVGGDGVLERGAQPVERRPGPCRAGGVRPAGAVDGGDVRGAVAVEAPEHEGLRQRLVRRVHQAPPPGPPVPDLPGPAAAHAEDVRAAVAVEVAEAVVAHRDRRRRQRDRVAASRRVHHDLARGVAREHVGRAVVVDVDERQVARPLRRGAQGSHGRTPARRAHGSGGRRARPRVARRPTPPRDGRRYAHPHGHRRPIVRAGCNQRRRGTGGSSHSPFCLRAWRVARAMRTR